MQNRQAMNEGTVLVLILLGLLALLWLIDLIKDHRNLNTNAANTVRKSPGSKHSWMKTGRAAAVFLEMNTAILALIAAILIPA